MRLFVVSSSLALAACTSGGNVPPQEHNLIIPPPAWVMIPPSNSVKNLDRIFSLSGQISSGTMQN
ncbi:Rz1 family lipoprotein [Yokenella regensburgei]|uniref:Rz1 family lipoprotein n=1 Tax=Yokenella regensburgei TaxID=158877 RepID=UPI003B525B0A